MVEDAGCTNIVHRNAWHALMMSMDPFNSLIETLASGNINVELIGMQADIDFEPPRVGRLIKPVDLIGSDTP